jgi:MFS family permease
MISRALSVNRIAISATFFVSGMLFTLWASRIPDIKTALRISNGQLGTALLMLGAGMFGALPLTHWLIERYGSERVTRVAGVTACLALMLAGFATSLVELSVALALFGGSMSALDVAMNSQASLLEKAYGRSIMSSFHGVWSVGALIGASLGSVFASRGLSPLNQFVSVNSVLAVLALLAGLRLVHDIGAHDPARRVFVWPTRPVVIVGVIGACGGMIEGGISDWSAVYLYETLATDVGFAALGLLGFSVAMAISRFFGDRLIDRFGAIAVLRAGGVLSGAAVVAAIVTSHPYVVVGAFTLAGFGMSPVFPIVFSAAGNIRGMSPGAAITAAATMAYGGQMIGPPIIGYGADVMSLRISLGVLAVLCLFMTILSGKVATHPRSVPIVTT